MICVVSHDAGGAEILSSHIRQFGLDCKYVLAGPALKIFELKLGLIERCSLEDAIRQSDWLLCGTSWQSDLEWQAIDIARSHGKRSAAFLDHWVNYHERFVRNGKTHLPDEVWVGDVLAEGLARKLFPDLDIKLIENPYFEDLRQELAQIPQHKTSAGKSSVLYVCEPLREHALREYGNERHWGYTEEDALRYFLSNLWVLGCPVDRIVIRPHPSETLDKYNWATQEFNLPIVRGGVKTLLEEVVECDMVVGCESMAMVVGLLAKRRVLSCIPPGGKPCSLPHQEIESLNVLLTSANNCQ